MKKPTILKPGDKFFNLTVIKKDHIDKRHYRSYYLFKCDCGKEKIILGSGVVSGNTKSCGCLSQKIKRSKQLPNNQGVINQIILQYKRHAKDRGYKFDLSNDFFSKIISQPCYYCGGSPSNNKKGFLHSGIDRIDSSMGYAESNVVPCCIICNRAKNNMSVNDFKNWIQQISKKITQWG